MLEVFAPLPVERIERRETVLYENHLQGTLRMVELFHEAGLPPDEGRSAFIARQRDAVGRALHEAAPAWVRGADGVPAYGARGLPPPVRASSIRRRST